MMRFLSAILVMILMLAGSSQAWAQRSRKRPPKQENVQTPQNAKDAERANKAMKTAQYESKREMHYAKQDKATRKRMEKNMKRSQKQSWGKELPWYKRLFRKRHF
jgi:Flp pilus assembly protein TadB